MLTDPAAPPRAWLAPLVGLLTLLVGAGGSTLAAWQLTRLGSERPTTPAGALEAPALRATAATAEARARLQALRDTLASIAEVDERQYAALADPVLNAEPGLLALWWLTDEADAAGGPATLRVRHALYATAATTRGLPSRSELLGRDLRGEAALAALQGGSDPATLLDFGYGEGQASRAYRVQRPDGSSGILLAILHVPEVAERLLAAARDADHALRLERDSGEALAADPDIGRDAAPDRRAVSWYGGTLMLSMWPRERSTSTGLPPALPWVIGVGGSLCGAGLGWLLWRMLARSAQMERLMQRRTSELVEAYDRARDSELMAMQAEKLSALGQMVAGVAHEINTPLGYISSNLQLLHDRLGTLALLLERDQKLIETGMALARLSPEQRLQWWHAAKAQHDAHRQLAADGGVADLDAVTQESLEGLARLADLVQTLKNFARVDRAPVDHVQINDCIRDTLKIAHNVVKHRAEIELDLGELPELRVNPSQINQVLLNLVTNAAQAIEGYGKVRIQSRADEEGISISVEDNGSGIPATHLHRIFEPFFSTKPQGEGTGLGLPIARKIIAEHGGSIEVHSTVGEGTRFVVRLPLLPAG
ncbi:MAG: ATP-binding protein [Xanthomonadales bacterium]|jgi:signal transduction histidine kinase|nr:ATP-binding protein [Xanthomonadales bacterium]